MAVFGALTTQWRVGFCGPVGLDYAVLPTVLELQGIPRESWPDLFDDIRTLESAALQAMSKKD